MSDSKQKLFLHRYPLEPVLGMVLGVAFGWGLFGAGFGALAGYFVRVLRRQLFEEEPAGAASGAADSAPDAAEGRDQEALEDAYRVLGVSPESDTAEIRRIYRNLAASFHPDGLASFSEDQRKEAEEAFVRIRIAWERIAAVRGVRS